MLTEILANLLVIVLCAGILKVTTGFMADGYLPYWLSCIISAVITALGYIPYVGNFIAIIVACILVYKFGSADSVGGSIIAVVLTYILSIAALVVISAVAAG